MKLHRILIATVVLVVAACSFLIGVQVGAYMESQYYIDKLDEDNEYGAPWSRPETES